MACNIPLGKELEMFPERNPGHTAGAAVAI
jgi:hypothetical protein